MSLDYLSYFLLDNSIPFSSSDNVNYRLFFILQKIAYCRSKLSDMIFLQTDSPSMSFAYHTFNAIDCLFLVFFRLQSWM